LSGFSMLLGAPVVMVDMSWIPFPSVYENRRAITSVR
jgi:hypothetical protein